MLARRLPDGRAQRDHLIEAWRADGRKPAQLDGPECPPELASIWKWYREIGQSRPRGLGVQPISYTELEAWARLRGIRPSGFEIECLRALDAQYLESFDDGGKSKPGGRR